MLVVPIASADQLLKKDFQQESFDKVIDFFDYARAWAVLKGLPKPPNHWHANVYMTYVNHSGFQMIYAGLKNISLLQNVELTIPMQTVLMHYKSSDSQQDTLVASSFLMVMGFNDSDPEVEDLQGTPDRDDNLWPSFSMGINLTALFPDVKFPAFNSSCEIIELSEPIRKANGAITWTWGMRYINLTALWVTLDLDNEENTNTNRPFGLATYDELEFTYNLTLHNGEATLHKDYVIGHMHDLFVFGGWFLVWPIYNHYNATGCFRYNTRVSDDTIYDFLEATDVSMGIVEYQKTILIDRETECTVNGDDVTDTEVDVTGSAIETHTGDGELICTHNFTDKPTYLLFNQSEPTPKEHPARVRTHEIQGYARNRNLFQFQTSFQRYIPLVLVGMYPEMYQHAKETITNIEVADCLYIVSYPTYGGYRIVHDPVLTAYFAPTQQVAQNLGGLVLLAFAAISIIVVIALLRRRRTLIPVSNV